MGVIGSREKSAESVALLGVTVTPRSRALTIRLPNGGLVWNRPTAVVVERGGQKRQIRIVDVTRILQLGLLGLAVLTAAGSLRGHRRRTGGAG